MGLTKKNTHSYLYLKSLESQQRLQAITGAPKVPTLDVYYTHFHPYCHATPTAPTHSVVCQDNAATALFTSTNSPPYSTSLDQHGPLPRCFNTVHCHLHILLQLHSVRVQCPSFGPPTLTSLELLEAWCSKTIHRSAVERMPSTPT
jgi:hypothetical protein